MNSETKICQNCKKEFVIEPEDFKFYEKISVPPPTWCPECRMVRRMIFRNERILYKRKCDLCKKDTISLYHDKTSFPVYCALCWYSDNWDPLKSGKDYDFNKPFFQQFSELTDIAPRLALVSYQSTNSDYTNFAARNKNCYLIVSSANCENCLYGYRYIYANDSIDCEDLNKSELCYECFHCIQCYKCAFCKDCESCRETLFSFNCRNCFNCFGCVNLRNKEYHWFNEALSKEEYFKKLSAVMGSFSSVNQSRDLFNNHLYNFIFKFGRIIKSYNCSGDNIVNSENCKFSFNIHDGKNLKNMLYTVKALDSQDCSNVDYTELNYESLGGDNDARKFFTIVCWFSYDMRYCDISISSNNLFACIGLRNKSYCILNKQYTKEDYEKLVPRIIEHMNSTPYVDKKGRVYKYGEFFPPELSPFAYNETIAQEYFPLTKEEAIEKGYSWKDPEARNYQIQITNDKLPDHIKDVQDDIVGQVIECAHAAGPDEGRAAGSPSETSGQTAGAVCNEQCTEAFKIIQQELAFLRKMNLPLPRLCPNCRHYQRIKQRNPLKLWHRKCQCTGETSENKVYQNTADHIHHTKDQPCPNEFETTYAPERPEIIYCEQCYLREVV